MATEAPRSAFRLNPTSGPAALGQLRAARATTALSARVQKEGRVALAGVIFGREIVRNFDIRERASH